MSARVYIARHPARASGLIQYLHQKGIESFALPVTETAFLTTDNPIPDLNQFAWLAFTSVNAVKAFADSLQNSRIELPSNIRIAVVGPATAKETEQKLRAPDLVSESSYGKDLADEIVAQHDDRRLRKVFWPCAKKTTPGFAQHLTQSGFEIFPWVCYETVPLSPEQIRADLNPLKPWDVAVFAAPSAVKAFARAWVETWDFVCVAIGQTTASALRDCGVSNPVVSNGTEPEELAEAVLQALQLKKESKAFKEIE
ncbi:uroporphyrinogen-III synthase [bacterium]|nr:uroporphyrinogen-III synthase [bacterium]